MPTANWQLVAPVLELDAAEAIRVAIAELGASLFQLRPQFPLRRAVHDAAVLLEEHVEQRVDGLQTMTGGDEVPAPKREDLLCPMLEPISRGGLGHEPALAALVAVLVAVARLPRLPSFDDAPALGARHRRPLCSGSKPHPRGSSRESP
jgi:hypothetical protein